MNRLTIDDQPLFISAGRTILEACREHGVNIPTLCFHPALKPYGACRFCMVEISRGEADSRLVAACTYPCEDGLVVRTNTDTVRHNRRVVCELFLASAHETPEVLALARELGTQDVRFKLPLPDACILCGLCVRACEELVGARAISLTYRGLDKQVSTPFEVSSPHCIGCGTCVLICPTGKLSLKDVTGFTGHHRIDSSHVQVTCQVCEDEHFEKESAPSLSDNGGTRG
jgi:NADH dehydrogenase/NADH:ubiquinone oxidoreductase subunit G